MIAAITPTIAAAVAEGVAEAYAREGRFSANISGARRAYQNTDGAAQQQIQGAGDLAEPASAAAGVGSTQAAESPAGQAGQLGQMLGMPMQMAGQAAQIPMQAMGMAASIPQGIMQGVQSAMQQVGQVSGMSGTGVEDAEKSKESEQRGDGIEEKPEESPPARQSEPAAEAGAGDGASAGNTGGERAPQPDQPASPRETRIGSTGADAPGRVSAGERAVTRGCHITPGARMGTRLAVHQ